MVQIRINYDLSIFGLKCKFWTIPTVNVMYTRSQNYIDMVVGEHVIQTFKVAVVVVVVFVV
jgi:hypothetical protein